MLPASSKTTMIDPLPARLPPGVPYSVPKDIKADPGDLFAYVCAVCYGPDILQLTDFFKISRQTLWIWRKHGKGVPGNFKPRMRKLIASNQEPFRLPRNASLNDLIRAPRGTTVRKRKATQNYALIDMLHRVMADQAGGGALVSLKDHMGRPVSSPYVFYRWAWNMGGVPRSYMSAFLTTAMQLRFYALYDYDESRKVQWEVWAERELAAPKGVEDDEDDETGMDDDDA